MDMQKAMDGPPEITTVYPEDEEVWRFFMGHFKMMATLPLTAAELEECIYDWDILMDNFINSLSRQNSRWGRMCKALLDIRSDLDESFDKAL